MNRLKTLLLATVFALPAAAVGAQDNGSVVDRELLPDLTMNSDSPRAPAGAPDAEGPTGALSDDIDIGGEQEVIERRNRAAAGAPTAEGPRGALSDDIDIGGEQEVIETPGG